MAKRGKRKLTYTFHDPNPPGVMADHLVKVFTQVNRPKVEEAIRRAMEEMPAVNSRPSVRDELRALQAEASAENGSLEKDARDVCLEL